MARKKSNDATKLAHTLASKRKEADRLRAQINALDERYLNEVVGPKMRKYIGTCFRYGDSSGDDKWTYYGHVRGVDGMTFETVLVVIEPTGAMWIKDDFEFTRKGELPERWEIISRDDYIAAVYGILSKAMTMMLPQA